MTTQSFRFLHAADLHLEMPLAGLVDYPDYLEDKILEAPFQAARRLFQQAAVEKVDFIILSGDVLDPALTGPYGLLFLLEEFTKLEKEGIVVCWAGGKADSPDTIPASFQFPANVHRFPVGRLEEFLYERNGIPCCRILGTSLGKQSVGVRPGEFLRDPDGLYTVAAYYGRVLPDTVRNDGVAYWALGGDHKRDFLARGPVTIHSPGMAMPRRPGDSGEGGVSLVEVNEFGQTKVDLVRISPIRWVTERVVLREALSQEEILAEMQTRCQALRESGQDLTTFVSWRFDAAGSVVEDLRYGNLASSLLRDLRTDFAKTDPVVYSVDVRPYLPDRLAGEHFDQETILGDYLRMLHFYQENPDEPLKAETFFPEELREYLTRRREYESRRAEQQRRGTVDKSGTEEALSGMDELRSFRPEVPMLIDTLSLTDENLQSTESGPEQVELAKQERARSLAETRAAAIREAALLGMELLSGEEAVPLTNQKSTAPRTNRALVQERRNLVQAKEGKESLS